MASDILVRDGPVAVPLDYVVPQSDRIQVTTVRASMDGTSATVAFYAVLQAFTPDGRELWSATSREIEAGQSADVSWYEGASPAVTPLPLFATPILNLTGHALSIITEDFGPFDVADWHSLLLHIAPITVNGAGGNCMLRARYGGATGPVQELHANTFPGWRVVENLAASVSLELTGATNGLVADVQAVPCGLNYQPTPERVAGNTSPVPGNLLHVSNATVNAGATVTYEIPPYEGVGSTIISSTGPLSNITLQVFDYTGTFQGFLYAGSGTLLAPEHPLVAAPMKWLLTNSGAGPVTLNMDTYVKKFSS